MDRDRSIIESEKERQIREIVRDSRKGNRVYEEKTEQEMWQDEEIGEKKIAQNKWNSIPSERQFKKNNGG